MAKKEPNIEESLERLEEIVEQMESEEISLDASFSLYEEGMRLLKDTNEKIDAVEKKVKALADDGSETDFEDME